MKKLGKLLWSFVKKLDKYLLFAVTLCSALGIVLIYSIYKNGVSSSVYPSTYKTQLVATGLGIIAAMVISAIDYNKLAKLWFLYAPVAIGLVMLTFTPLGIQREGTDDRAWIDLGVTTFQPSEVLKLAFIFSFAYHLTKVGDKINNPLNVILLCAHGGAPILLVSAQGDQGTAIVFGVIFIMMIFVAGISWKYITAAVVASPILAVLAWNFLLLSHHKTRIKIIFNPDLDPLGAGNQQRQGKIALGSGQLYGKGLFGGEYSYVAEVQNDFIFSYLGQTLGFVGCMALCCVIAFICIKLMSNAAGAKDITGKLICTGVFALFFAHAVMNIGMVIGVMPVIGVPLPFVSAGGTAVLSMYMAIGMAMSVHSHNEKSNALFY